MSDIPQPNGAVRPIERAEALPVVAESSTRSTPNGVPYDPVLGITSVSNAAMPPMAESSARPRPSLAMPGTIPAPTQQTLAPAMPQPLDGREAGGRTEAVASGEPARFMEVSDIYGLPDLPQSVPVVQTFVLNGVPLLMKICTDAMTDAEKFYELTTVMQGKRNPDGSPAPRTMVVQPPDGERFTLTNPVYIGGLNLLSATVAQPRMSPEEWAMLGKKIGAKGRQKGWHGIEDIADVAAKANGMGQQAVSEDEQGAGEGESPAASNTA